MIDDKKYGTFVKEVTSGASANYEELEAKMYDLTFLNSETNPELLLPAQEVLTAALGLSGESGEFTDMVKKLLFHGKTYDAAYREKMILELSDIMWYVATACRALHVSMEDVVAKNVEKLSARHKDGFNGNYKS